ncbi:MAG: DUF6279 family lipoprotein [Gallionellaceae bacterium]|nr:DUF6279 family lipoprotein [Gallionellaceae bacterium]
MSYLSAEKVNALGRFLLVDVIHILIMFKFITALLLFTLSGCSLISVGYNHADTYLRYNINGYTSFNAAQKSQIEKEVDTYMQWHRKQMLPEYIHFLTQTKQLTQSGAALKREDVTRLRILVKSLYSRTLQPAIAPTVQLLKGLNAAQIDELKNSFAEKNAKQRKTDLAEIIGERLKKRAEKTVDYIEDFVGHFSDKQLANIRGMSYSLPYATELYLSFREQQQARLIRLLKNQATEQEIANFLFAWLMTPELNRSTQNQATLLAFENAADQMIVDIYGVLTVQQKITLQKNIDKYLMTFKRLAENS